MYLLLSILAWYALFPQDVVYDVRYANLEYKEVNGEHLTLDAFLPGDAAAPTSAVIFVHGGGWFLRDRDDYRDFALGMARKHIAGIAIDFRLLPDNGWQAQLDDIKDAIRWVRTNHEMLNIDPDRIGIFGSSSGGHLAALAAFAGTGEGLGDDPPGTSSAVQSAVILEGLYDLTEDFNAIVKLLSFYFTGGTTLYLDPATYKDFSPFYKIDGSEPPTLFLYASRDTIVPEGQAERTAAKLIENGAPAHVIVFPGLYHGFTLFKPWTRPNVMALLYGHFLLTL